MIRGCGGQYIFELDKHCVVKNKQAYISKLVEIEK